MILMFFLSQAYTKVVENEVRGTAISCSPLHNAIRTLKTAATKVNGERKVNVHEEFLLFQTAF